MRVMVTGAAGFIGSHVVETLVHQGHQAIGVDNFNDYYDPARKEANARSLAALGVPVVVADVRDTPRLESLAREHGTDSIVHLAALAGVRHSVLDPVTYMEHNSGGTQSVLEVARNRGVTKMVVASTSSVYDTTVRGPHSETQPCTDLRQPYALSKRCSELTSAMYCDLYGLNVTVTRLFTVYGPRGRPDMMPYLLARSIRHGERVNLFEGPLARDWTYVTDTARGIVSALENCQGFDTLNIGRGQPVLLSDFIDTLEKVAGDRANLVTVPRPPSEMIRTWADTRRARRRLGFRATVSVEQGVRAFWDWYVTHDALAPINP